MIPERYRRHCPKCGREWGEIGPEGYDCLAHGRFTRDELERWDTLVTPAGTPIQTSMERKTNLITGWRWLQEAPATLAPLFGEDQQVLWSKGEAWMLYGPTGVGKGTIMQQVCLARIGVRAPKLFGLPLAPSKCSVYFSWDRPDQIRRSFARMVADLTSEQQALMDERLYIWHGPLDFDIGEDPEAGPRLVNICGEVGADSMYMDSLKDAATELEKPAVAARVNRAIQFVLAAGIEIAIIHHPRKAQVGNSKPKKLDDVFGGTWLTAGCGSVSLLWGEAGDTLVSLEHLKQPAEVVGPLKLQHNHATGTTTLVDRLDLFTLVCSRNGITAGAAAATILEKEQPSRNEIERFRQQLKGLVRKGLVWEEAGNKGGRAGENASIFYTLEQSREQSRAIKSQSSSDSKSNQEPLFSPNQSSKQQAIKTGAYADSKSNQDSNQGNQATTVQETPTPFRVGGYTAETETPGHCWRCGAEATGYDSDMREVCEQHIPARSSNGARP